MERTVGKKDEIAVGDRKKDHIDLAFESQVAKSQFDNRFYYEPMLSGHPGSGDYDDIKFIEKKLSTPIWVSSMTGGTGVAKKINENLARACKQFGMGMGLGSCRPILNDHDALSDFDVRPFIGDQPLYANLGVAQVEELLDSGQAVKITEMIKRLSADGLIVHVNPMQEWLQPEGDHIQYSPIDTIKRLLELADLSIIVKEVGQGFGPKSMLELMKLPISAIEFAAHGGTNFAMLEMMRSVKDIDCHKGLALIGHTAEDMVDMVNKLLAENEHEVLCREFIISGGIKDYLSGYYLINRLNSPSLYGQASSFLKHAQGSYEELESYVYQQVEGLKLAHKFLRIRPI